MKITSEMLETHDACQSQIELFNKYFPDGIEPTLDMCKEYYNIFGFQWAAYYLLTKEKKETFDIALKSERDAYDIATISARETYDIATKSGREAFDIAIKSERDTYNLAICQEFVKQWIIQNS